MMNANIAVALTWLTAALPSILKMILALALALLLFFLRKKIAGMLLTLVKKASKATSAVEEIIESFRRPLDVMCILLGAFILLGTVSVLFWPQIDHVLVRALKIGGVVLLIWGAMTAVNPTMKLLKKGHTEHEQTVVVFLGKIVKCVLAVLAIVIIIDELGYNISGFIAGIGLGGLPIALAAQDTASNFFGGLVIISDHPFSVGDWIQTPDLEGVVSDITMRTTRIRTFMDAEVIVPNATLSNAAITNWSRMNKRRLTLTLTLTYATNKEKLQQASDAVKAMLDAHPDIVKDSALVTFSNFSAYSLDLSVVCFTDKTATPDFMLVKEKINYEIMECFEKLGVDFAYPTQTLRVEKGE